MVVGNTVSNRGIGPVGSVVDIGKEAADSVANYPQGTPGWLRRCSNSIGEGEEGARNDEHRIEIKGRKKEEGIKNGSKPNWTYWCW